MKTIVLFVLVFSFQAAARTSAQTITLVLKNAPLSKALEQINKQAKYDFTYNDKILQQAKPVTLSLRNETLERSLQLLFAEQNLTYEISDGIIIIEEKPVTKKQTRKTVFESIQQEYVVTGKVTDSEGTPLVGVSVGRKGTPIGTTTDDNGIYRLAVPPNATLVFRYVGYGSKEINVGERREINVFMEIEETAVDEVVVVGYGTQKKSHLTGAVSTINVKENLEGRPIADIGRGIQGVAPGLNIAVPSGEVGVNPIIRIRGQVGSLNGGDGPLILLDNVEIPNLQLINPNDVESITVLKDAAATSIYGAKAALGVVLITTKQGSNHERVDVNYSNNLSFQNPWKIMEMAGSDGIRYLLDAYLRQGQTHVPIFVSANQESYERTLEWEEKYGGKLGPNDPVVYGRDWYFDPSTNRRLGVRLYDPIDYNVREWAPTMQHSFSVGGTSGKTTYNIGLGLLDQSGMNKPAKEDVFKRYNASLRLNSQVNKFLNARAGVMFSQTDKRTPFVTLNNDGAGFWHQMYRFHSLWPIGMNETGDPIRGPWSEAQQANTGSRKTNFINLNLGGRLDLTSNWKVDIDYSFSNNEFIETLPGTQYSAINHWVAPVVRNDAAGNPVYVNRDGLPVDSSDPDAIRAYDWIFDDYTYDPASGDPDFFHRLASNYYRHTVNAFTTYDLTLDGDHDFKFMLGLNRVTYNSSSQRSRRNGLIDIINPQFNYAVGEQTTSGDASWEAQLGYFSRVNYAYQDKYLFEANLRYDGSSKFPTDLRWRWFPSFSAGWVLSEEDFMQWTGPVMNFFKFRGSWGTIGDQSVSAGLFLPTMAVSQNSWVRNGSLTSQVGTPSPVSANITWQDITTLNLGLDARFWDNRLGVTFDLYRRDTENMIVPRPDISPTYGTTAPLGNFGSLRTRGWELEVDFSHRFDNGLGVNFRGNLSDAVTTITAYGPTKSIDSWYVGKTYGEIWGYETDRLYQYDDFELDVYGNPQLITLMQAESALYAGARANWLKQGPDGEKPVYQAGLQASDGRFFFGPGDVKYKDLNGDGEISPGNRLIDDHGDLRVIGNETPRYQFGFRLGFDYKGIDFSAFFQGVGSRQLWRHERMLIPGYNPSEQPMPASIASNYWTPENPNAFYPAAYHNASSSTTNNFHPQTRYLLDMSYMRLKNVTLGYSLPQSILNKVGISSTRVYTSLENFLTWDNLGGLVLDPEAIRGVIGNGAASSGRIGANAPLFKSVSLGLQLDF